MFQIVINNGFYCRKSYRRSAITRRDIITGTLVVLEIGYSNSEQYTAASAHLPLSRRQICATKHAIEGRGINYHSIPLHIIYVLRVITIVVTR
jgi:hypothetical protein